MFKRILVAVDGSEGANQALKTAVGVQKACGAELLILTVYRHHSLLEASMSMVRPEDPPNIDDVLRDHASKIAEDAKALAASEGASEVRAFVKSGPPARTVVRFAEEREADLIVIGNRGLGDVEGFLLGSVSHKVTSLAPCTVMTVK